MIEKFITEIDYLPKMIGVSETKLNVNTCLDLNIPFYDFFFHHDLLSNASGVGICAKQILNYGLRADISLNVPKREDIWIEVSTYRGSIIFAIIYRHPKIDFKNFQDYLSTISTDLQKKQKHLVSGDINVNFSKVKNYLNLINALGSKFLINVPTRFLKSGKTFLLYHISSNITKRIQR